MKKILTSLLILMMSTFIAQANNVTTSNVFITGQNVVSHFSLINFDINWENSWRTSTNENNYDGCWLFVKFRKVNSSNWQHATMNYVNPGTAAACGHTEPAGSTIQTPADGKGIWIYRSADGQGTANWANARLRWNYGADGVNDNDSVEVRLFAVEMVYCPQGAFKLGSGGVESNRFRDGVVDTYYNINSENSLSCGSGAGQLYTASGGLFFTGTLAAGYPKGFKAVWCMKYETSQQQYVDFLNTIDFAQYVNRAPYLNYQTTGTYPNINAINPERAIGYISSIDLLSLLDWSALRPMSEMEFEKICRGANQVPIASEYAWGSTVVANVSIPSNQGLANESWGVGNCNYIPSAGAPIRCGALATGSSNRVSSGATYYGVMEMSGNVTEWVVSCATVTGRAYTGIQGDGNLDADGEYNQANWPIAATGAGFGARAGAYTNNTTARLPISDRLHAAQLGTTKSVVAQGGRGCRTGE